MATINFQREVNRMDNKENQNEVVDLLANIIINYLNEQRDAEDAIMDSDEAAWVSWINQNMLQSMCVLVVAGR